MTPWKPSKPRLPILVAPLVALLVVCTPPPEPPPAGTPKLVLFIVVDQLRADYLERFGPLLEDGLQRLQQESVQFADAHHFHSETVTATGHATLATGSLPRHHGIVGNSWYDRESGRNVTSVTDRQYGRSPRRLLVPTLGDRLKQRYPDAKVFGIGGKDRSAILTAGLEADAAYWYDRDDGLFVTSEYYRSEEPEWLGAFHESEPLQAYFSATWSPLYPLEEVAPMDVEPVDWGLIDRQFPHPLGGPSILHGESFHSAIYGSPFMDAYVVELAKALIEGEELGSDEIPDFLGVTLPATDAAGHTFGPNSPELADTVVRVDRVVGELLDFVDRQIGLDEVVVVLSSDHGVGPIPELLRERGDPEARRFDDPEITCFQQVGEEVRERFGEEEWVLSGLYFDYDLLAEQGVDQKELEAAIVAGLSACPGVARVHSGADLLEREQSLDPMEQLFFNSYHPQRSGDLLVQLEPNTLASRSVAASHGSPYLYDTHVPWLLRLPGTDPVRVEERVHTIDVVPTLAPLLDLEMEAADGVDRSSLYLSTPSG